MTGYRFVGLFLISLMAAMTGYRFVGLFLISMMAAMTGYRFVDGADDVIIGSNDVMLTSL